jgi:hypothetical protein
VGVRMGLRCGSSRALVGMHGFSRAMLATSVCMGVLCVCVCVCVWVCGCAVMSLFMEFYERARWAREETRQKKQERAAGPQARALWVRERLRVCVCLCVGVCMCGAWAPRFCWAFVCFGREAGSVRLEGILWVARVCVDRGGYIGRGRGVWVFCKEMGHRLGPLEDTGGEMRWP